mmetsp:Transcript_9754/g.23154  ORF Transcript_9754/g.23154 Transcript_9754/m.23154 type:complete len:263 (-) Transcript_9754:60-848(-)
MLDVKRKLESITSFMLPQSSPTVVQAIMKRVKGTNSWERQNLRKNTQENVAMVQDPEIKFSDYVKPQRKLNTSRSPSSPMIDDCSSSGTGASFDSTEGSKHVLFGKFVEEICYLSSPPDLAKQKASEECKAKVLAILGLEASPLSCCGGDAVLDAVSKARENSPVYPKISMIPINDEGREMPSPKIVNVAYEKFPTERLEVIMSCGASTSTTDSDQLVTSSEDTDSHSHDEDEGEIIPLQIGDEEEEDEDNLCPIRALSIAA